VRAADVLAKGRMFDMPDVPHIIVYKHNGEASPKEDIAVIFVVLFLQN
jgi:hypothetical protein